MDHIWISIQLKALFKTVMTQARKFENWLDSWWNKGIILAIIQMWQCYCGYFSAKSAYFLERYMQILGWPKSLFGFSHTILRKNPNELFGQTNIYGWYVMMPGILQNETVE